MSSPDHASPPPDDDVSAADKAERRLRLGRNLSSIGDAVIVTDPAGGIILLNDAAESLTGWSDGDARDLPIAAVFRIINEVTRLPVVQPVDRVIDRGGVQELASFTLLVAKDGVERPIDDSASPLLDAGGGLEGVVLIFRDISGRRAIERGLEEDRIQGQVIIAAVRDGLVVLDGDLRVWSANRSFYETFRTSPAETIGRTLFDLGDGQWDGVPLRAALAGMLEGGKALEGFAVERAFPTIGARSMSLHARALRREGGRGPMILLTIADVTGLKRAQLSIEASELRYRRLFETAQDGILILDQSSGAISDANPFLLRLLGYSLDDLVGKHLYEIGLIEDEPASRSYMAELQAEGYVRYEDLPLKTSGGREVDVEFVSNVYRAGEVMIIQCNIRDITARKRADALLRRAKEEAEEASRAKDLFLAALSHELRTPLTPVLATVEYLETRSDLPAEIRGDIASIRRNVELEARLIDDLLDVTRIGQGKLEIRREVHDVHLAVRSALEICQAEVESKKLEVSLALRAEGHMVWADPARIRQVFWNLIKNAVKFTPDGGSVRIRSSDAGSGRIAIEVADTGAGIDPAALTRIFGVFEQGGRDVTRRHGGLGLGLSIARMLVDLHGGSLTATSGGKGLGSVFRVELEQITGMDGGDERPPPTSPPGGGR